MKKMATALALAVLLAAPAAMAQPWFGWTISNSTTNPLSNSGPIAPGPSQFAGNLYLWYFCNVNETMSAAEFDIVETTGTSGATPTGFNAMNGFLNADDATHLLLAVGSCPSGPILAGAFAVGPDALIPDIELCIVPSVRDTFNLTVSCDAQSGYDNGIIGFHKGGPPSCVSLNPTTCELLGTPVQQSSWGQIKGLYR